MTKRYALCLMWIVGVLMAPVRGQAQDTQAIADQAFQSTVLLVIEGQYGESIGSGFFVGDRQVITNVHVVDGAGDGYATLVGQEARYPIKGVTATDPTHDLAVLKVEIQDAGTMTLADSAAVQVGQPVYAVGNPKGLEGTVCSNSLVLTRQ